MTLQGGVVKYGNPEGSPPARSRMKEISCRGCRRWFTANHFLCPTCGWQRPGYHPGMRGQRIDAYMRTQAARAKRS